MGDTARPMRVLITGAGTAISRRGISSLGVLPVNARCIWLTGVASVGDIAFTICTP